MGKLFRKVKLKQYFSFLVIIVQTFTFMMHTNMAISFSFQFFNANKLCGSIQTRNKWSFINDNGPQQEEFCNQNKYKICTPIYTKPDT